MSRKIPIAGAALLALTLTTLPAACASGISTADLVVVNGLVQKGPTGPICSVDNPCVAPVTGGFAVTRGGDVVVHFRSDADGRFRIRLAPGDYAVVPDPDTVFGQQTRDLKVPAGDSVSVTVTFDTGIY